MEEVGAKLIAAGADAYVRDMGRAGKATDQFADEVGDAAKKSDKGASIFSNLGSIAKGALAAGLGVAVGAAVALGGAIVGAQERAAEFRAVLGQDIGTEQIAAINEEVSLLERRFGADLPGTLDATRQLMANFGLSGEEAMDVITAGFENGLNVGDDLLDTIREYSPLFANLGFDADDTLSIINRGLEAGARNSDVVADAVKEFGILIREPATLEAVAALDQGVADLVGSFQEGGISGEEAFNGILARIGEIEDPILRNQLGVELLGTKWEDLGEKAALSLGKTDEGLVNSEGAAERAGQKLSSLSEIFPRLGDIVTTALIPLGDGLLAIANENWPAFESAVRTSIGAAIDFGAALGGNQEALAGLPEPLQAIVGGVENVKQAFVDFAATPWGQEIQQGAQVVAEYFSGPWQADFARGVGVVQGKLNELAASEWGQDVQQGAQVIAQYMANDFPGDFQRGAELVGTALGDMVQAVDEGTQGMQDALSTAGAYMLEEFPGDFERGATLAGEAISGFAKTIGEKATEFATAAQEIGAAIVDGISGGITAGASAIGEAARDAAQAALSAAKQFLGIASPSRTFAEDVGQPISEGIAVGITQGAPLPIQAITGLAQGLIGQTTPIVTQFGAIGLEGALAIADGLGRLDQAIAPVREWSDAVADALSSTQRAAGEIGADLTRDLAGSIERGGRESEDAAVTIGADISSGIEAGIDQNTGAIRDAAIQAARAALDAAQAELGIASPSQVFADQVGEPVVAGMAEGILDNLPTLLDAVQRLGSRVIEEAEGFAETIRDTLGPILAEAFAGAADYARAQIGASEGVEALGPDMRELDRITQEANRVREQLNERLDDIATRREEIAARIAELQQAGDTAPTDERGQKRQERLTAIEEERKNLQFTAAYNIDPKARERAVAQLTRLAEEEAKLRAEAATSGGRGGKTAAEEIAALEQELAGLTDQEKQAWQTRNDQLGLLAQQQEEAVKRFMAQEAVQRKAQEDLQKLRAEAEQIEDPAERAAYYSFRQKQILELARLDREIAGESVTEERATLEARRALLVDAQSFETRIYEQQAEQRQRQQAQALADAASAMEQLGALVYFSQQDMQGVGSEAIRGVAAGMLSQLQTLSTQLGGAFDQVIANIRRQLGIASPSRVFADLIGAPLALGIGAGFTAQLPAVEGTIKAQVARLPASASSIVYDQRSAANTSMSFGPFDLRGAAPGVGAEVRRAIQTAMAASGSKADVLQRTR